MPGGEDWYRQQIREYTTLDLDPDEIHAIGLRKVDRIQREMDAIIRKVGFDGDFAAFLHSLRTDPQFYAKAPEELLRRPAWIAKRVDGEVADVIGTLPRGRFTIVPVRSEEHTSELQSLMRNSYAVLCLQKKTTTITTAD